MKITKEEIKKGDEIMQTLVEKAWKDANFKEQLVNNPKSTIESITGNKMNLPENTSLTVEDQTDSNIIYLNIPKKVSLEDFELTEEQLEAVSGGTQWWEYLSPYYWGKRNAENDNAEYGCQ